MLGQEHSLYLDTAYNMAQALSHLNRYEQALELYRLVVSNRKKILGDEHVDTLKTVHEMARVLQCIRLYEEALVLYQQVLSGRERRLGKQHPDTLDTIIKMAQTLNSLGRYEEAMELYEQVLLDREDNLEENPGILATAYNIAKILSYLGRYEEAADLYEKVLPGRRKVLGNDHPDTLVTIQDMAFVLSCLGRYVEALELYGEILGIQENELGKEHPDSLNTAQSMASVFEKVGWLKTALELYQDVLVNRRRILGREHPDTLDTACKVDSIIEYLWDEDSLWDLETSKGDVLPGPQWVGQSSDNEEIGKEYPDTLKIVDSMMATPARSNSHILRDQETFMSVQQTIATQGGLPGGEYLKTLEQINEKIATPEELGRQNESPKFNEKVVTSGELGRQNESPKFSNQALCSPDNPSRDEDQNTLDIILFLRRQAKLFEDATWKVKYKISALEFLIIRELESYKLNRELPIRVCWECVCGKRLFDDFQEFNDKGPAAQCVLGLNQKPSGVDSMTPTLGLPDLFSFPTKVVLGGHCPLDFLSFLVQVLFGGLSLPGFFLPLRVMWGRSISSIYSASQVSYPTYPTTGGASNPTLSPSVHLTQTGGNPQHPQQGNASSSNSALVQPHHTLHNHSFSAQVSSTSSSIDHLLLCFNDESVYFQSIQLGPSTSDQQIFTAIREEYYRSRGWWKCRFSFEVLKRVEFVKFEIYYQNRVEIRARGDLPPVNNTEYKYLPRPAEMIPPVPGFMYFFHKPECAPTSDQLLTKMPKKVSALRGLGCGWGIHFIEEPCMFRIYMLAVFIVVIDSIFAVVWSVLKKDIQGGFGVAAFITSVGAIFMAIGWRQVV